MALPSHPLAPGSSPLPDDIRLKCSYYASEIKTQVNSLYGEQHKWLEDHLSELKETLAKVTEKKAGTRAVMAGIIKTPSRKRNKVILKKTSRLGHLGLDLSDLSKPSDQSNPSHPLCDLKRSHLNMNGSEIQEILHQQFERERSAIEARLHQDLSCLENQYESPIKKPLAGSTVPPAASMPTRKPFPTLVSPKLNSTSIPSEPFRTLDINRSSPPLPSANKPMDDPEPVAELLDSSFSHQDLRSGMSPAINEAADSGAGSSAGEQVDPNDSFAAAGHELSAIQEGEEEEDPNPSRLPPLPAELVIATKSVRVPSSSQSSVSHSRQPSPSLLTPSSPVDTPHRSSPTLTATKRKLDNPRVKSSDTLENSLSAVDDQPHKSLVSSGSSSAPETNSVGATVFDPDPIAPSVSNLSNSSLKGSLQSGLSQSQPQSGVTISASAESISKVTDLPSAPSPPISASPKIPDLHSSILPSGHHVPSGLSDIPGSLKNLVTDKNQADVLEHNTVPLSSSPSSEPQNLTRTGQTLPPLLPITSEALATHESDEDSTHSSLHNPIHRDGSVQSHFDAVVEVPLTDKPSSLRNNLHTSTGSSHSTKTTDHQARTPGDRAAANLFTPGNPRAAAIQSPHSQWSSKPSGSLWNQSKPFKTPATILNLAATTNTARQTGTFSGSPSEDFPQPSSLLSNSQTTNAQPSVLPDPPVASLLTQGISFAESQDSLRGLKRTSTDAGFNYTSDAHDAKISRSHTPGLMHIRSSTAGTTGRKGMEDLKSRLSKIQRESAMHERVHHHAPGSVSDAPMNSNQRTSLVTHNSVPSLFKPLTQSNASTSAASLPKTSTFPNASTIPGDPLDWEIGGALRIQSHATQSGFIAPIELPASIKSQAVHSVTEPIKVEGMIPAKAFLHSNAKNIDSITKPTGLPTSEAKETTSKPRSSNSSSGLDMDPVYSDKRKPPTKEAPVVPMIPIELTPTQHTRDTASFESITKIESKHLAFLTGATLNLGVTAPPTSSVVDVPLGNPTSQADEALRFYDCPVAPEDTATQFDRLQKAHSAKDATEDDHDSVSSESSEPGPINDGDKAETAPSGLQTVQVTENREEVSEDEDPYGEPSVEIISSTDQRATIHDAKLESQPRREVNFDQSDPVTQPEIVQTPEDVPATPRSPVSATVMGVLKAGAALASAWTGSKAKPELKSLQLAAEAAKKEQDERDRKATLKEERRVLAVEKKQAEEKAKAENERLARIAEVEKKKQEREEAIKSRTTLKAKLPSSHSSAASRQASMTGDAAKKRKVENESNRAMDLKKSKVPQKAESQTPMPSSAHKPSTSSYLPTRTAPIAPGSAIKASSSKIQTVGGSASKLPMQHPKHNQSSRPISQATQPSGHTKVSGTASSTTQLNSSQMSSQSNLSKAAHSKVAKGKMREEKKAVEEEYIELPDIDSEYSDDDESEHERKEAKLPEWAQSPALREALANQRKVNPDDVFGGSIPPPRMDEIFRGKARASKFRHRTSSANWTGADQLTALEEAEYAKRMGYQTKQRSIKR